ncbi:thioredoxin-related transmembrane protein 1 [Chironomus tepperi]|uniref:thioredoxin-related transmembrane protein 1 n=1 Tax=Chironomus tepperi TaxID=113505 RepID=UPI00391F3250
MFSFIKIILLSILLTSVASKVVEIDEENWPQLLDGEWMVEFFAPWCPACKSLESVWADFGTWSNDLSIKVAKVDVVKNPGLSGRFFVTALPTIYHVNKGEFRRYSGTRDINAFMSFIEDKKWADIDVISGWKKPDGVAMGILSWFFRLSHFLKEINNTLSTQYGLPTWVSYGLFAIATIILGAVVGLILVCIIDFIWPQKPMQRQSFSEVQEKDKMIKRSNEMINEDLVDDTGNNLDENNDDTSEAEKNSGSDEEEDDEVKEPSPKASPDVRKRRTRKAD